MELKAATFPLLIMLAACMSESAPLDCGDERASQTISSVSSTIVNGAPQWDSAVVALTESQARAVGAIMTQGTSGWVNTCTGTLIAPQLVLTAAHCITYRADQVLMPSEVRFAIGDDVADPLLLIAPLELYGHPDYSNRQATAAHDVAVLVLEAPIGIDAATPLPYSCTSLDGDFVGQQIQTVGYGQVDTNGSTGNTRKWWAVQDAIALTSVDFTVDGYGQSGVCYGDSGGPALWTLPGSEPRLIGTLSWGDEECANQDHFVRVDNECDFIADFLEGCGDETGDGRCDGGAAIYCDDGLIVESECEARGLVCGDSAEGQVRCIDPCDAETFAGRCDGDDVVWCEGGTLRARDCAACGQQCGWVEDLSVYYCQ